MDIKQILDFKNTNIKIHEIIILSSNIEEIQVELKKLKKKLRSVLMNSPVLLNLGKLSVVDKTFINEIIKIGSQLNINIIGVKNIREKVRNELIEEGKVNVFMNSSEESDSEKEVKVEGVNEKEKEVFSEDMKNKDHNALMIFYDVIRTGQKIKQEGSIAVLSKVNSSAEIYATGSVFVSAPVYGKVFAGVSFEGGEGDPNAVIYIEKFNANLIAINGIYRQFENIDEKYLGKRVRIYLEEDMLKMELLETL